MSFDSSTSHPAKKRKLSATESVAIPPHSEEKENVAIKNTNSQRKEHDKTIKFLVLCHKFEEILHKKTHAERIQVLTSFWELLREAHMFPFIRLTIPQLDRDRVTYGLKESKIAKYYIELLCIPTTSADADLLRNWKDPSKSKNVKGDTSFSDVVYYVLEKRGWAKTVTEQNLKDGVTVAHVNQILDDLAKANEYASL